MAGLSAQEQHFKLDSGSTLEAAKGGASIDALLNGMAQKDRGTSYQMNPQKDELAVVTGKESVKAALDRLAQRDGADQAIQLDTKTHTLEVASGREAVKAALQEQDKAAQGRQEQTSRVIREDGHDEALSRNAGVEAGGTQTAAQVGRSAAALKAIESLKGAMKGDGSHAATIAPSRGKGGLER